MSSDLSETEEGAIALAFTRALVSGDFEKAFGMLDDSLKQSTSRVITKVIWGRP
jgi:hypothetical protein